MIDDLGIEQKFQSTLPMRGATLICCPGFHKFLISIHAPHAGSDLSGPWPESRAPGFQSTLPMRGATPTCKHKYEEAEFQSTLPMRGATQRLNNICIVDSISIHAPHAGSDRKDPDYVKKNGDFNPRSPCGERLDLSLAIVDNNDFNPRSPCGERQLCQMFVKSPLDFNPRSPCGERPFSNPITNDELEISIHAPHAGSDRSGCYIPAARGDFNPRSPCGERPVMPGMM